MLKRGDRIGIVCCSNGQKIGYASKIKSLEQTLIDMGLCPVLSDYIYEKEAVFCGTAKERANALMEFYKDESIKVKFEVDCNPSLGFNTEIKLW